jgi:hypothetical protein
MTYVFFVIGLLMTLMGGNAMYQTLRGNWPAKAKQRSPEYVFVFVLGILLMSGKLS